MSRTGSSHKVCENASIFSREQVAEYFSARLRTLRRESGVQWQGPCPFGQGDPPEISIEPGTGRWNCFQCHIGGGIVEFEQRLRGVCREDALYSVAVLSGVDPQLLRGGPAPPKIELLDVPPPTLSCPLDIVAGHTLAATWACVQRTETQRVGPRGEVVRVDPPEVSIGFELRVVREDGKVFGSGGDHPLSDLGVEPRLPWVPLTDKLWRLPAVRRYQSGQRPDFAGVFQRLATVYDHFIDFSLSVAEQSRMCELCACASLTTWTAAAHTVLPYFWFTGEKGSAKTKCGTCYASTSYLGEIILSSGTFAAIRDLADYRGAMMFDDAEILSDPRKSDPSKRELLLAGNRKGTLIPLKEPAANGKWTMRCVNAYCSRAFTAIRTPDPTLGSRAITIPLVRTANPAKANNDPANTASWPCDYQDLMDQLWATALALLLEAQRVSAEFDGETSAFGRDFEPWRAILVVARLFERHGVPDLEKHLRDVMGKFNTAVQDNPKPL